MRVEKDGGSVRHRKDQWARSGRYGFNLTGRMLSVRFCPFSLSSPRKPAIFAVISYGHHGKISISQYAGLRWCGSIKALINRKLKSHIRKLLLEVNEMSTLKSKGYVPCNDLIDAAVDKVYANQNAPVTLPWIGGVLGTEATILLLLAQRFGALGVAAKTDGASCKYKFYYSRESTGSWFTEVWPMWKVSAWFLVLVFFALVFHQGECGAGSLLVGIISLAVFGGRALPALKNSVVSGQLSGYSYARESFPLIMAGAAIGVIMTEWAFVFPWKTIEILYVGQNILQIATQDGVLKFMYLLVKTLLSVFAVSIGSTILYQSLGAGMMRSWLQTAYDNQLVLAEPERGTWFHKLRTTGIDPWFGVVNLIFLLSAAGGMAMPFL
jgi:hypothetical protein